MKPSKKRKQTLPTTVVTPCEFKGEKQQKRRDSPDDASAVTNTAMSQTSVILPSSSRHNFETNSLDHCETPLCAYQHIQPLLEMVSKQLNMESSKLRIYDPYYCDGAVIRHLASLGYDNVINENTDFYQRIQENTIPEYDVLLTNPPYSDDHIERLLHFVTQQNRKPFCLLMPNWVARKADYKSIINGTNLIYLSPIVPYSYIMPTWSEKPKHVDKCTGETTPYLSSWYISIKNHKNLDMNIVKERFDAISRKEKRPTWVVAKTVKGLKWKIQNVIKKKACKS